MLLEHNTCLAMRSRSRNFLESRQCSLGRGLVLIEISLMSTSIVGNYYQLGCEPV